MLRLVQDRVARLRLLSIPELACLPHRSEEFVDSPVGRICIHQFHETPKEGDHKIVVQTSQPVFFGIATALEADGFVRNADGIRLLREEELWNFL